MYCSTLDLSVIKEKRRIITEWRTRPSHAKSDSTLNTFWCYLKVECFSRGQARLASDASQCCGRHSHLRGIKELVAHSHFALQDVKNFIRKEFRS